MATCTCPGVTECDQVITIGFLNSFIGSDVQDSSGAAQTAAGDSDYCPTYSELTGGTLIQNWKQGTTPNGDQDGIIIGGTYAANECVRRSDLSMKYTRFKEFSISAASTTLSACSASTTISYTHKYDRCEKKLDSTCESSAAAACTAVSDTQNSEVTLTSSNNVFTINGFKVNVPKNNPNNNGRSNARSTTITGKITFRGTDHTATVGITQNGLTGEYQYWYHTYDVHDKNISCSGGPSFGCAGGNYSATAYYYQDDWDVYRWHDVCGTDYNSDYVQRNRVNDQYKVYSTYSGSFPDNTGTGGPADTDSVSWDGYGSCSWSQSYCPPPDCPTCDCDDTVWGYGTASDTVGCTGGTVRFRNITIPGTAITYTYDEETSACTVTTAATSTTKSTSVSVGCNTTNAQRTITGTKNNISYSITQDAGPCCSTSRTYSYETITLSCVEHTNESVSARYTATTVDSCCNTSYTYGITDNYTINVGCNSGSTRTLSAEEKSNAPFTVQQLGDAACCITCKCENEDLQAEPTAEGLSIPAVGYTSSTIIGKYSDATCLSSITASSSENWVTNISASNGNISAKVQQNTSTENSRTSIITVSGKDGSNQNCPDQFIVIQAASAITCTCSDLTVGGAPSMWAYDDMTKKYISMSHPKSCITDINVGGTEHFNVSANTTSIAVWPKGANVSQAVYQDTLSISYKASNTNCSSSVTLTQDFFVPNCDCSHVAFSYAGGQNQWEISAQTGVVIGTISIGGDCTTGSVIFTSNSPSVITNIRVSGTNVLADLPKVENDCKGTFKCVVNGVTCDKTYEIVRMCYCGTDNCTKPGVYEHPLHIEYRTAYCDGGTIYYDTIPSSSAEKIGSLMTGDHFYINHGELLYHGAVPTNGQELLPDGGESWVKGEYVYTAGSCPHINYTCDLNNGSTRTATFTFTTPDSGATLNNNCVTGPWAGHLCCKTFYVEVTQAGNGNAWEKIYQAEGDSYYREIPMSGLCSPQNCQGGSTIGITSCVSSAATSSAVQIGTWSKTPAGCTQNWSVDNSRSVSGNNFINISSVDFRSDGTIYAKISVTNSSTNTRTCQIPTKLGNITTDYFTITQCAGGSAPQPTQCNVSLDLISSAPAAGSATMYIGAWSVTGYCTNPTTLTYVSGAGNFLSSIDVRNNGGIYATVAQNTSSSSRTSRYRITYGTATAEANITQLGVTPPSCNASLNMYTNIAADERLGQVVGTYTTNCEGTPVVSFDGVYSNFLSNISCQQGMVFANVAANVSSSARNGQYKLSVGGQTATSVATQVACGMRFHIVYKNTLSHNVDVEWLELRFNDGTTLRLDCGWDISAGGQDTQNIYSTTSYYGKLVTDVACHADGATTIQVTPYTFTVQCDNTLTVKLM